MGARRASSPMEQAGRRHDHERSRIPCRPDPRKAQARRPERRAVGLARHCSSLSAAETSSPWRPPPPPSRIRPARQPRSRRRRRRTPNRVSRMNAVSRVAAPYPGGRAKQGIAFAVRAPTPQPARKRSTSPASSRPSSSLRISTVWVPSTAAPQAAGAVPPRPRIAAASGGVPAFVTARAAHRPNKDRDPRLWRRPASPPWTTQLARIAAAANGSTRRTRHLGTACSWRRPRCERRMQEAWRGAP